MLVQSMPVPEWHTQRNWPTCVSTAAEWHPTVGENKQHEHGSRKVERRTSKLFVKAVRTKDGSSLRCAAKRAYSPIHGSETKARGEKYKLVTRGMCRLSRPLLQFAMLPWKLKNSWGERSAPENKVLVKDGTIIWELKECKRDRGEVPTVKKGNTGWNM